MQSRSRQSGQKFRPFVGLCRLSGGSISGPELVLGRPSSLNPKHARTFNSTTVEHHFELLENFIQKHDIPWENVYNMDEKGI